MKPSRRRRMTQRKQEKPRILLTADDLKLLKSALVPLEKRLLLTHEPLPNLQFALDTVAQVQQKVDAMLRQQMHGMAVGFDANEALILKTALYLYIVGLEMVQAVAAQNTLLPRCQRLLQRLEHRL